MQRITSPFPDRVAFSCKTRADYPQCEIHPEEAALLSPAAVEIRRVHFTLGRAAAREALRCLLGPVTVPVLSGAHREPLWPAGVVGAITHSGDLALAAVAHNAEFAGLGIDIEELGRSVSFDIARHVCTVTEMAWAKADAALAERRLKMIFSAKESIFKATYPLAHVYLDFLDAELTWDEGASSFSACLRKRVAERVAPDARLTVGCQIIDDYVVTSTWLPPLRGV